MNSLVRILLLCALAFYFALKKKLPSRAHNFSAGPAMMNDEVMKTAYNNFLSHDDSGMNIMEMSHRDHNGPVQNMMIEAERNMRDLLNIPENYYVLYMHGGAHAQFSAVPLNLNAKKATYVITGYWSNRAKNEASKYVNITEMNGIEITNDGQQTLLHPTKWHINKDSSYVYFCASETIDGLEYFSEEGFENIDVPIVADFTSTLLSRPVDISKYGIIFASGGKNLGPSGVTVVIIRDELVGKDLAHKLTPSIMSYYLHANSKPIPSIYNTPPTYPIYIHSLVVENLIKLGGVEAMKERADKYANIFFDIIDNSNGFYTSNIQRSVRSHMNIPIRIGKNNRDLEQKFIKESKEKYGLLQLFGHPVSGGIRITMYNGIREESLKLVAKFMLEFEDSNSHLLQ